MTEQNHLLDIKNLDIVYQTDAGTVHAVNGISFSLDKGKTLGLVGETGAGKTTTAMSMLRVLPERTARILGGSIVFDGKNVLEMNDTELKVLRGAQIAMIFQDPMTSLNPLMTVGAQIAEAVQLHHSGWSRQQIDQRVDEVLAMVGILPSRKGEYPHQFSGGMKQRVVIAIALSCEPDLLIADEPTTALDVTIQAQVLLMIRDLIERLQTAMIMITHDLGIVAQTCDDVAVMYAGELIEYGPVETVFDKTVHHHPYTVGLFGSIPNLRDKAKRLAPIPGMMPDPTALPKGCNFSPRCPFRTDECDQPDLTEQIKGGHKIKCLFPKTREEIAARRQI